MRMHELADTIGISRSGLTYQIARLERHGWVERSSEAGNARAVIARLTDAGRERAASMQREHLSFVKERIFGRLSEEEIRLLLVVFRKIAEGADSTDG